jgi:release factor glutamine methyltransferase
LSAAAAAVTGLTAATTRRQAMALMIGAFETAGVDDAAHDARLLLCAAAGIDHAALIRDPEAPLEDETAERLSSFAARRLAREPVTRILGERGFWSLNLEVAAKVLDPRPDSETLIDAALRLFADRQDAPLRLADLGSGSGALICALLDIFPNATGLAVDIAPAAMNLTRRNLARCGFGARAEARLGDWRDLREGDFDLVVSNPPYIASEEIDRLDPEVRNYDPRLALDGGPEGLDAYRSLAATLPRLLKPGGRAIVEVGWTQAADVLRLLESPELLGTGTHRDLAGVERAVLMERP